MSESKILTPEEIARLQAHVLAMLKEFDRVCRAHGIVYTISNGTLLGAIRHKGFIPWDDDGDISMMREEYERFRAVAHELDPSVCFFQDHYNDPPYRWGYGKLRRTGTTYIRTGQEHMTFKTGVAIDIFPMDDIPRGFVGQALQNLYCICLRKVLWSEVGKMDQRAGALKRAWFALLAHVPADVMFRRIEAMAKRSSNRDDGRRVRALMYRPWGRMNKENGVPDWYGLLKSWHLDVVDYEFEDTVLMGSRDYDAHLRYMYGKDYMTPLPPEQRVAKSPCSTAEF